MLNPDATPHNVNGARHVPFAYRDQPKGQLDDMLAKNIIGPVCEPSEWCHPIVMVNKINSTEKRLTVDLRKLNDQVCRPTYPTTTLRSARGLHWCCHILHDVGCTTWLLADTALRQREAADDLHHPMVTFPIRFCCNPPGLISAGDEFNRRTDAAFANIPKNVKVVDDCLVHNTSFQEHVRHVS